MQPEGSLSCSQEPSTCPYHVTDRSSHFGPVATILIAFSLSVLVDIIFRNSAYLSAIVTLEYLL
jgi:hypothetical protein